MDSREARGQWITWHFSGPVNYLELDSPAGRRHKNVSFEENQSHGTALCTRALCGCFCSRLRFPRVTLASRKRKSQVLAKIHDRRDNNAVCYFVTVLAVRLALACTVFARLRNVMRFYIYPRHSDFLDAIHSWYTLRLSLIRPRRIDDVLYEQSACSQIFLEYGAYSFVRDGADITLKVREIYSSFFFFFPKCNLG